MATTGIEIVRAAIIAAGGNHIVIYYASNTNLLDPPSGDTIYIIPQWEDGLTPDKRIQVVASLNAHVDIKQASISVSIISFGVRTDVQGRTFSSSSTSGSGNITVQFYGVIS